MGRFLHLGSPFILSKAPAVPKMAAPCLGEHTEYVCTKILGISDEDFVDLVGAGAFD
jgi:crotonobetainyl-CoA:carnitine CoA-transferase CaiB-like acyl-CoA transferase